MSVSIKEHLHFQAFVGKYQRALTLMICVCEHIKELLQVMICKPVSKSTEIFQYVFILVSKSNYMYIIVKCVLEYQF